MKNPLLIVHAATFLLGFIGVVVQSIDLPALVITAGRSVFELLALACFVLIVKEKIRLSSQIDYVKLFVLGVIQAVQWLTFFISIQMSSVAIGLLSLFTFPLFTALLEPLLFKEKYEVGSFTLALIILTGILLIVPEYSVESSQTIGVLWGVFSAILVALLLVFSRLWLSNYTPVQLSFYKSLSGAFVLLPVFILIPVAVNVEQILKVSFLGIFLTALPYLLVTIALKTVTAAKVTRIISFEPVYGILLAAIVLNEIPALRTMIGGALILFVALFSSFQNK